MYFLKKTIKTYIYKDINGVYLFAILSLILVIYHLFGRLGWKFS